MARLTRASGRRPSRARVLREVRSAGHEVVAELDRLVARGLVRPDVEDYEVPLGAEADDAADLPADDTDDSEFRHGGRHRDAARKTKSPSRVLKKSRSDGPELGAEYLEAFERRQRAEWAGLASHTASYIGVNAIIAAIWAFSGAGFPWFLFPLLGWGIGYVSHRTSVVSRERELADARRVAHAGRRALRAHRSLWKLRNGRRSHLASNVMTMLLLGTINLITGSAFPWALIPIGFMGVGLVAHYSGTRGQLRAAEEEVATAVADRGLDVSPAPRRSATDSARPADPLVAEAQRMRDEIETHLREVPEAEQALGSEFSDVLANYLSRIEQLSRTQRDVDRLIAAIPLADLERERADLEERSSRRDGDSSAGRVVGEYRRRIEQIDQQIETCRELGNEHEMLQLRLRTAVNALAQLRIDVARTRHRSDAADNALDELRRRSGEISAYLEDLREGFSELDPG